MYRRIVFLSVILTLFSVSFLYGESITIGDFSSYSGNGSTGYVFKANTGHRLRITPSGDYIVRIQAAAPGDEFLSDDHYEMVADHNMGGKIKLKEKSDKFILQTGERDGVKVVINKTPLRLSFYQNNSKKALLTDKKGVCWDGSRVDVDFKVSDDQFFGIGHPEYSRQNSLNLTGREIKRNYIKQAPLLVPFFFSHNGYGIFMNSTFENRFRFNCDNEFSFGIDDKGFGGQMDYYFIVGPKIADILDRYSQLTGRPRLPQKSMFGLQLSDKGSPNVSDEKWWMKTINEHRNAGYPIDHIVNDNRWRAGSGAWAGSRFEWAISEGRYPDPARWAKWVKDNGLTMTLDLNRNSAANSWGWKPEYNIPNSECVHYGNSVPDYSSQEVRDWNWKLFWEKSMNPELNYPGDAFWMDEPDDLHCIADETAMADGRTWAENKNYYFFLIAKAVVQQGWDNENGNLPEGIGQSKRPFVWVRGMTAGGQRYATHWSGDVDVTFEAMAQHVRAMQASGLAAFPYYNHDAGGFHSPGPDDDLYRQWSMAFGSFSPIWRPHGPGVNDRWPLNRNSECQKDALVYSHLRYELMPYTYTLAYQAHESAMPMARAMIVDYQDQPEAWNRDLQYMWGPDILVAPNCTVGNNKVSIWLPAGDNWIDVWTNKLYEGDQVISYFAETGKLPLFVKQGGILPKADYAKSTFWMDNTNLTLDIYAGKDGRFDLYEDDGITERFRTKDEFSITSIKYDDSKLKTTISPVKGDYDGMPEKRSYTINIIGLDKARKMKLNGKKLPVYNSKAELEAAGKGYYYDEESDILTVLTGSCDIESKVTISK